MKKILLTLFGFITLGLVNFGSCSTVSSLIDYIAENSSVSMSAWENKILLNNIDTDGYYCFVLNSSNCSIVQYFINSSASPSFGVTAYVMDGGVACLKPFVSSNNIIYINTLNGNACNLNYSLYRLDELLVEQLPTLSSSECQSTYNLVPSSDLSSCQSDLSTCYYDYGECQSDLLDCQSSSNSGNCSDVESLLQSCNNDLGMCQSNLSSCMSGGFSGENWSALFVNSLQFPGKPIVNVLIPDYITWDYTSDDNSFNLSVGSGYDVDYINSVIDINSYRPTSEDFTGVFVSGLTLIMPYIGIVLLILFTRKLIN